MGKIQPIGLAALYVKKFDICYFIKSAKNLVSRKVYLIHTLGILQNSN
jgi:hypothetical protein